MKPTWLVHNYDQEEYDKLVAALIKTETPYKTIEYKSFMDTIDVSELPKPDDCVVFYGSLNLAKRLRDLGLNYCPGNYGYSHKADCSHYYSKLPKESLLNFPYALVSWMELKRSKDYYKELFFGLDLFVRPNSGTKIFPGQLVLFFNWDNSIKEIEETSSVNDETLVLISKGRLIKEDEYRFVIVDKKVVSGSQYDHMKNSSPECPQEAWDLAKVIADQDWQLDSAYTCDIAFTNAGPRILELNSFSCAGLYSNDREKIVHAVNAAAVRDHAEVYGII